KQGALAFNLGNGQGYSVQQVIDAVERVVAKDGYTVKVEEGSRRAGDPAILVADSRLICDELGWKPQYLQIEDIVQHAWSWELQQHLPSFSHNKLLEKS